ncbi:MAG: hypothetical protein K2X53_04185 [Alphaproteobacteria bacterium]|nr:hypothetical protein [Alphaproteobacteria bacterium]
MRALKINTLSILMMGGIFFSFSNPIDASRGQRDDESNGWFKPGFLLGRPNGLFEKDNKREDDQLVKEIQAHNAQMNQKVDITKFLETFESLDQRIRDARFTGLEVSVDELSKLYSIKGIGNRAIEKIESTLGYLPMYTLETSTPLEPGAFGQGRLTTLTASDILKENADIVIPFFKQEVEQAELVLASFKATDQRSEMIHTFYVASLLKMIKDHMPFEK